MLKFLSFFLGMHMGDDAFIDLGNGMFYAHDDEWSVRGGGSPFGYVADTYASEANVVFGPAAWKRGTGPQSASILLEIGDWTLNPEQDLIPSNPSPFPGTVRLRDVAKSKLGHLEGARFDDIATFVRAMTEIGGNLPLRVATFDERLDRARALY
jgi:hypothetical protein